MHSKSVKIHSPYKSRVGSKTNPIPEQEFEREINASDLRQDSRKKPIPIPGWLAEFPLIFYSIHLLANCAR